MSHDDVTEALRGLFIKHGVVMVPSVQEERQEGNRCVLRVLLVFHCIDNVADFLQFPVVAHGVDNQDKGPGKAYSYAIKMGLLKLFMIPSGEKDLEEYQIEHSQADPEDVRSILSLLDNEDGEGIVLLTDGWDDERQIKVWREINTAAKKKMRTLINEYRSREAQNV